ncbi:Aldehyde/histidinol dehydrogenase [Parasitella parasitica]|nr:Aldehyde/histidinol dehydrogenase [Parasitella parasitica]
MILINTLRRLIPHSTHQRTKIFAFETVACLRLTMLPVSNVSLVYTSAESIEDYTSCLRGTYVTGKPRDAFVRKFYLERLHALVKDNEELFYDALAKDLEKSRVEALSSEISPVLEECLFYQDKQVKIRLIENRVSRAYVRREALGIVLIIYNTLMVKMLTVTGAFAAGNCVIVKLSEISVHTLALITELLPKYLDASMYRVFDHIFNTGNSQVAKPIMAAASQHMTSVTLKLGGKSPAIVTEDAVMQLYTCKICEQIAILSSCVAIDYFLAATHKTLISWYGANPRESKDYGRIVNQRHFGRLIALCRYIAPTVITDVRFDDTHLVENEIFGPLLPAIAYSDIEETMGLISKKEPPLALYLFPNSNSIMKKVLSFTASGGVAVNDTLMHQTEYALPFVFQG